MCARACATRASLVEPGGPPAAESVRRRAVMCAEVCDATCRVLSEQDLQDETVLRVQVEWCRAVCLECARMFDRQRGGEKGSRACRDCARACTDFLAVLG
ncbi:hypothetical protein OK074_1159 [Actinobacteria bacterium OK074]|nr:hypothetical protein OK074_1159 [Actinobacteria bacterium OK074]